MIALITPTGARPAQVQLCAKYMRRQTYTGRVCWVVVDDCVPCTTAFIDDNFRKDWEILHVHPRPAWQVGQNTQGRNLAAGVDALLEAHAEKDIEAIYIIEDDDWYSPVYLHEMQLRLQSYHLIGETHTMYYNVQYRRYHENLNAEWSSLFQTAFTPAVLPEFRKLYAEKFIDFVFFKHVTRNKNLFRLQPKLAVGMKGMTGRTGIGAGHRFSTNLIPDTNLSMLKFLIGDDADAYAGYWDCGHAQH